MKFKTLAATLAITACLLLAAALWFAGSRQPAVPQTAAEVRRPQALETPLTISVEELRERIATATAAEFPELMRLALGLKNPLRDELATALIRRWLQEDLESFVVFLDEIEIDGGNLWDRLAPALMAALPDIDEKKEHYFALREVIERVILNAAATDPHTALSWARQWLMGHTLDATLAGIAAELAAVDLQAAMALVPEIKSLANRMEAASDVGRIAGAQDPEAAFRWAATFTGEADRTFAMAGILEGLAVRDTARASAEYSKIVSAMKERYREQVLADRAASGTSVEEEYEGLSPEEIAKAELARPNPNLIYLEKTAYIIGTELARGNPLAALEWARSLDIYQGGAAATEAVFEQWASRAPLEAYQAFLRESQRRPELAASVFLAWAAADPSAASTAALKLSPGTERDHAVEGVARGWIDAGESPEEIARWTDSLITVSEKDRVRAVVAAEAAYDNPAFAWEQVSRIQNPAKRAELFQAVFPSLVENNPKLARKALSNTRLSTVETEYFESMLAK